MRSESLEASTTLPRQLLSTMGISRGGVSEIEVLQHSFQTTLSTPPLPSLPCYVSHPLLSLSIPSLSHLLLLLFPADKEVPEPLLFHSGELHRAGLIPGQWQQQQGVSSSSLPGPPRCSLPVQEQAQVGTSYYHCC